MNFTFRQYPSIPTPTLPLILLFAFWLGHSGSTYAQSGPRIGISSGYALQEAQIPKPITQAPLTVLPGHNAYLGIDLRFPLAEQAELRTGFRLRNQTTSVRWNISGSAQNQRDDFSVVELPLGFGLSRNLGQHWTLRQVYGAELQVLGSGSATDPSPGTGPVFQVLARPERHVQGALSVQAELGYCTAANFCLDLHAGYHQGFSGTQTVATAVFRSPDLTQVYPLTQSGSYFSTGLALSLPAGRVGRSAFQGKDP